MIDNSVKNNESYTKLIKNTALFNYSYPKLFIPTPSDKDYDKGMLVRYFCKKVGSENSNIIEISKDASEAMKRTKLSLYVSTEIEWKISGPRNTIIKNKIIETIGVEEFNLEKLIETDKKFEGIKTFLQNKLTQFWRGF